MTYSVVQWTTGHVGREAVKGIMNHPELVLIGAYAWSENKIGKDIGELCDIDLIGIQATSNIDALMDSGADCVCYTPNWPNIDEMVRILEAGINMVCSLFISGSSLEDEQRNRLIAATQKGNSTLFGSGIFPGFAPFIAGLMATASQDFRCIRFLESVDLSHYQAFANFAALGWGQSPDQKWAQVNEKVLGTYSECIDLVSEMLSIPITEKRFSYQHAVAPDDREFFGFRIPAGNIAGQKCNWIGMVGKETAVELDVVWKAGSNLIPDWPLFHGYTMEVDGNPNIRTRLTFSPSGSESDDPTAGGADLANQVTAMAIVNAIPAVCEADAGIRTYAELPLITGRYMHTR